MTRISAGNQILRIITRMRIILNAYPNSSRNLNCFHFNYKDKEFKLYNDSHSRGPQSQSSSLAIDLLVDDVSDAVL